MRKLIHGGDVYRNPDCIDFSANINPLGPPDSVKKAVAACVNDIAHYPDVQCKELKKRLGWAEQMEEEALIIGNGAAELIFALGYSLRPKRALLPQPTFAEYEQALLAAGCEVFYYPLSEENGFRLTEDFLQVLTGEIDMVFLCNPNNPTGVLTERDLLIQILNRCKEKQIFLVVDECFLDFVEEAEAFELKEMTGLYSNLFLLKAFTKRYAIPGLRLGYGICQNKELLEKMEQAVQPWNVSVPAQAAGIAALEEDAYVRRAKVLIWEEKAYLRKELIRLGMKCYASEANYIFFRGEKGMCEGCRRQGILIRDCQNYPGLSEGFYRVAVRTRNENKKLIEGIERWQKQL